MPQITLYLGVAGLIALLAIVGLALYLMAHDEARAGDEQQQSTPAPPPKKPPLN